jgi:hypothetical protein
MRRDNITGMVDYMRNRDGRNGKPNRKDRNKGINKERKQKITKYIY